MVSAFSASFLFSSSIVVSFPAFPFSKPSTLDSKWLIFWFWFSIVCSCAKTRLWVASCWEWSSPKSYRNRKHILAFCILLLSGALAARTVKFSKEFFSKAFIAAQICSGTCSKVLCPVGFTLCSWLNYGHTDGHSTLAHVLCALFPKQSHQ